MRLLAANLLLDFVQSPDLLKGLERNWRGKRDLDVVELAPYVRPAGCFLDLLAVELSRRMSKCSELDSMLSGRPSRKRARWLSAAANSAARKVAFSFTSKRAILTSPDMKTLKASFRLSTTS